MKPFIVISAHPHSFQSLIKDFLQSNGATDRENLYHISSDLSDSKPETNMLYQYIDNPQLARELNLKSYFEKIPEDQVTISVHPILTIRLYELPQFTDRKIKVVYVLRNPERIIAQSMAGSRKSFAYYYEKIVWLHQHLVSSPFEVLPLIPERLKTDAINLLTFCELSEKNPDYKLPGSLKPPSSSYLKYRIINFVWKRLEKLFRIYEIH